MILLSYLGSHWALFIIVVLLTAALFAAAYLLKNAWYILGSIALVIAGLAYQSSNIDGYKRKAAEDAQAKVLVLQRQLLAEHISAAQDAQRATSDAFLNTKLDALSRETPINTAPCLAIDAVRRVREIASRQPRAPAPASRFTGMLQGHSTAP